MTLIYKRKFGRPGIVHVINDYFSEILPFVKRIKNPLFVPALITLKTVEFLIYKFYIPPVRRFYGIRRNELLYMITKRCTDKCAKCGIWKNPEPDSDRINAGDIIKCIRDINANLYQITITGGEPLLFMEDVLNISQEAERYNIPMIVITNGTLVNEVFLKRYNLNNHFLVFSIDTLDKEKWKGFRGVDNYELVMKNLNLAYKILENKLRIQSVLAKETINELPAIQDLCKKLGILHSIQPYMDFGGSWMPIQDEVHNKVFNTGPCAARKNICVYPEGDVVKCFDHMKIPLAIEPLGNIGFEDIMSIMSKKRTAEVTSIMKNCNLPCKHMSCNKPANSLDA